MSNLDQGLVAYYPLYDDANDQSGNNNHGEVKGVKPITDDRFGSCMNFQPNNYVTLNSAVSSIFKDHDFTASAWINGEDLDGEKPVLGTDDRITNKGLHLVIRSKTPYMGFFANDLGSDTALSNNTWYHVVWRYIKSTGEQAIFINGIKDNSGTGHAVFQGDGQVMIGRWSNGSYYFTGKIAMVRIYNRPLADDEIKKLHDSNYTAPAYNASNEFHLPLNEISEGKVFDKYGKNYIGTVNGAQLVNDDKFGKCMSFDGVDDYLDLGNIINPEDSGLSMSVWFNSSRAATEDIILNKEHLYEMAVKSSSFKYALQPNWAWLGENFPVTLGTWYHVTVVYDGKKQYVYKDGIKVFEKDQTGSMGSNDSKLLIGARGDNKPHNFFKGKLADLHIYKKALSDDEIKKLHDSNYTAPSGADPSGASSPGNSSFQDSLADYCGIDKDFKELSDNQINFFNSMGITKEYLNSLNILKEDRRTVRIQVLQGGSECFEAKNPVIKKGEWAYEIDTGKLKIGDGQTHWNELEYKVDIVFTKILKERIKNSQLISEKGKPNGYTPLDENSKVPLVHLPDIFTSNFAISVVQNISERDKISNKREGTIVFVIDATADTTVSKGAATYIWANSGWVKVSELEGMDIDLSLYFNKQSDTLDDIKEKDSGQYIHFTGDYKTKISQNKIDIDTANIQVEKNTTLINYVKSNLENNYYPKTFIDENYVKKSDMQLFIKWLFENALRKADVLFGGQCSEDGIV